MALLQLDPLPEALDLWDLEGWQVPDPFGLQPEAQDLQEEKQWCLSSSCSCRQKGTKCQAGPVPSLGMLLDGVGSVI